VAGVSFTATATAGALTALTVTDPTATGTAGTQQAQLLTVTFADQYSNPIPGLTALGSGPAGSSATPTSMTSNAAGQQQFTIVLAPTLGIQTFTFVDSANTSISGTFTFTAVAGTPTSLTIVSGDQQTGAVGQKLAVPLVVAVADANQLPVAGVAIHWAPSAGTLDNAQTQTGANGQASTGLTLGTMVGETSVVVTSTALANTSVTFAETASAGALAKLVVVSGANQTTLTGEPFTTPFVVRAEDASGNAVSGVTVAFSATSGGGSVAPASFTTGANGLAQTQLMAGATAGSEVFTAQTGTLTPVTVTVTADTQPVALLVAVSGNGQTAAPGHALGADFVVEALDAAGQPVPGAAITFKAPTGGSVTPTTLQTNAQGEASALGTLSTATGPQVFTATSGTESVTFDATATTTPPTLSLSIVSGNNQTGSVGATLTGLTIEVVNTANHNAPVAGVTIAWTTATGGTIRNGQTVTGANGQATASLQLSTTAGPESVTVTATSTSVVANSPVTFEETATPGTASTLVVVSGGGQSAAPGAQFTNAFVVKAEDASGNVVSGASITFGAPAGASVSPVITTTDATGEAQTQLTAGSTAGTETFTATLTGTTTSVQVTETVTPLTVTLLRAVSGAGQSSNPSKVLPLPLVVQALDSAGAPVAGATITFKAPTGGSSSPTTVTTNAQGEAQVTATLGPATGTQVFTAASGAASVTFSETASSTTTGEKITIVSGDNQTAEVGKALPNPLVVEVTNGGGAPLSGITVTWATTSPLATVSATSVTTNAQGQASINVTLGKTVGTQAFTASCAMCTGSPVTFTETGTAAPASKLVIVGGDGQSGSPGATLAGSLVVEAEDSLGNGVSGVTITFAAGTGGGTVAPTSGVTGANGEVSVKATLGAATGPQTFVASATGLGSVTFTETATQVVSSISISPQNLSLEIGGSQQYVATAIYQDGTTGVVTNSATWSTGSASVATISNVAGSIGLLKAVGAGSTTVTATYGGQSGSTPVTVAAAQLASIVITPANASIAVGTTLQFTATGTYSNQLVSNVTASCAWSSSNVGVATVSAEGVVTGVAAGTATLTCKLDGITATRAVTVTASPVAQLEITPANVVQPIGSGSAFTATATLQDGTVENVTTAAEWSSSDTTEMTVQNAPAEAGRATFLAVGTPDVIATYGGLTAQVQVTIINATVTSLTLTPGMANLAVGDTQQLTLRATYSNGTTATVTSLASWTTSDASIADVSNAPATVGLVTAIAAGNATVTASFGGQTATCTVAVNDAMAMVLVVFQQGQFPMSIQSITVNCDVGTTIQLEAGVLDTGAGRPAPTEVTTEASWSTSNGDIAVVDNGASGGLVQCLAAGTATITAAWEGQSNTAAVDVSSATLQSITIAPIPVSLSPAGTSQLHATGTWSDGTTANVTALGSWTSSAESVATVSNAATTAGLVTGVAGGTATITITYEGVTATVTVTVSSGTLTNVIISPANPEVAQMMGGMGMGMGGGRPQTYQLSATALFSDGSTQNITTLATWSITNPNGTTVATISNQAPTEGLVTIDAVGTCTVTVTYEGMTGTTTLTVYAN
jgi:uncharacterized protein YjdB